jgi:hypothetical protein
MEEGCCERTTAMWRKRDDIVVRAGSLFDAEPPSVIADGETRRSKLAFST